MVQARDLPSSSYRVTSLDVDDGVCIVSDASVADDVLAGHVVDGLNVKVSKAFMVDIRAGSIHSPNQGRERRSRVLVWLH